MRPVLLLIVMALTLAGCGSEPVRVGSKTSAENRVVAEMIALRLESAGLAVERRMRLGDSPELLAALRAGAVDVYPEYTGTALALLGLPSTPDRAAALSEARAGFAPLGLRFLDPLGYESRYVVAARRETVEARGVATVADLARSARRLRLGVTRAFAERAEDGLEPFLDRYGLVFGDIEILPDAERPRLYDLLLAGELDVVVGFSTDPEIGDYLLSAIPTEPPFFPAYEATPLVSETALARAPEIEAALAPLAGRLDGPRMRRLVRQVQVFGRAPRAAAADALARLGLGEAAAAAALPQFRLAMPAPDARDGRAARLLRAVREATPGREVAILETDAPLEAVSAGEARIALAPALALFDPAPEAAPPAFEAVAAIGSVYLHALALTEGPDTLSAARRIASGPVGSPSHRLAEILAETAESPVAVTPLADRSAGAAAAALRAGRVDAALVLAGRGRSDLARVLRAGDALTLIDAADWWRGPVRVALPVLRPAVIPPETYPGQAGAVDGLATQLLLVGPGPRATRLGDIGPGVFAEGPMPLTDATVLAIDAALGATPDVTVHAPVAAALAPRPAPEEADRIAQPGGAVLLVILLAFGLWCARLFAQGDPDDAA